VLEYNVWQTYRITELLQNSELKNCFIYMTDFTFYQSIGGMIAK